MPRNGFKKRLSSSSLSLNSAEPTTDNTNTHTSDDASDTVPGETVTSSVGMNATNANTTTGAVVCQSDDEGNVIIEVSDACVCTHLAETITNIPEYSEVGSDSAAAAAAAADPNVAVAPDAATIAIAAAADPNVDVAPAVVAAVVDAVVAAVAAVAVSETESVRITAAAADINVAPNSAPPKYGCFRSMWKCFKGACILMCCCCCRRRRRRDTSTSSSSKSSIPVPEKVVD